MPNSRSAHGPSETGSASRNVTLVLGVIVLTGSLVFGSVAFGSSRPLRPSQQSAKTVAGALNPSSFMNPHARVGHLESREALAEGLAFTGPATPSLDPEDCGPDALPETGLQGQVPRADQQSGRAELGYRCGLELVGQTDIDARGMNFQMDWLGHCAYVGMAGQIAPTPLSPDETDHPFRGTAVIDASDPQNPEVVDILKSPAGISEHEAIEINAERGVLAMQIGGVEARWIEVYDVSEDCREPVLKGRYDSGGAQLHGMEISPDGKTIYATNTFPEPRKVFHAIDITDLSSPQLITTWDPTEESPTEAVPANKYGIHDLKISADGTRAYLGAVQRLGAVGPETPTLVILDISDIQNRVGDPDPEPISETYAANFGHSVVLGEIDGTPYAFTGGELPFVGPPYCPWAWGHIIDISDESDPKVVSDIKLEVNEVGHCAETTLDDENYSIHFNGVDHPGGADRVRLGPGEEPEDVRLLFHSWYDSGLRVFDVRDPKEPREIAYYNPPVHPGTVFNDEPTGVTDPNLGDPDAPRAAWGETSTTSSVRYRPETGHIWVVSVENGFQVLELTDSVRQAVGLDGE